MKYINNALKAIVYKFPRLALAYRAMCDGSQLLIEPQVTSLGFNFFGNQVMMDGEFEEIETEIVKEYLAQTDLFINIGANIGYYCCIALNNKKPVIAFEPLESNLRYLYSNINSNNWGEKIEIFPVALSNKVGLLEIFGGGTGASLIKGWAGTPENYKRLVPVNTLDNVISSRFDGKKIFVLVDIEGAEKGMLEGAEYLLHMQPKPIWMIEITVTTHQPKGVGINPYLLTTFKIFWDAGYQAYTADRDRRKITYEEVEAIQNGGKNTLDVHNFLFIA